MAASSKRDFQVVRLKRGKLHFEILTHPNTAKGFRAGQIGFDSCVAVETVFKNASKAEAYTLAELTEHLAVASEDAGVRLVLAEGEIQLNAQDRRELAEEVHRRVVGAIHRSYIDPRSNLPHPIARIENALAEAGIRLDLDEEPERQVAKVVKDIMAILPCRKAELEAVLTIPHASLGAVLGTVHSLAAVSGTEYDADGAIMTVTLSPGDVERLCLEVDRLTGGAGNITISGSTVSSRSFVVTTSEDDSKAKAKGKPGKRGGKK